MESMLTEGSIAPDFELPDRSGALQTLDSLSAGSPLVLVFYRVSCPVCQFTFPFLDRISNGKLRIVGVSQDDAEGTAEFYGELGLTLPSVIEKRGWAVGSAYRITNVPTMFVIEPMSKAISVAVTGFSKAALEAVGQRAGLAPFGPDELIPAFRPG
jgi:peroxiredoxin